MYDVILLDLDGTVTDSSQGITNSVAYALSKWGIMVEDRRTLHKFSGPALTYSFHKYYGFEGDQISQAVNYYREYYEKSGIYENKLYDGMRDLLEVLHDSGKKVILATSKPEIYARQILDYFKVMPYFDQVLGANMDGTRLKKAEVVRDALKLYPDCRAVMVGDREYDIKGADANQIDSIGVLYGFGSREELEGAGATRIVNDIHELKEVLL